MPMWAWSAVSSCRSLPYAWFRYSMSLSSAVFGSFGMQASLPARRPVKRVRPAGAGLTKQLELLLARGLCRVAERLEIGAARKVAQSRLLDLPGPLGGDAKPATGVSERGRSLSTEAEPQAHNVALTLRKLSDRLFNGLLAHARSDLGVGLGLLIRHQITERRVAVVTDGLVEAGDLLGGLADLDDLFERQLGGIRDLLVARVAPELRGELTGDARDATLALRDVDGQTDHARAVFQPALNRLTDPQRRVGRELEATPPIELLGGADQPQHALLDEIGEREALTLVAPSDRDDEPQVRVDHAVLRHHVATLDALGELDLFHCREQRVMTRLVQKRL